MIKIGIVKLCISEMEQSEHPLYKMGAVVFKGSRIISSGHNQFRSSNIPSQYKKFDDTLHAEQAAILGVEWKRMKNSSILVMRMNQSGNISMAYPCNYCYESIVYIGIKWIYYTNRQGEIVREKVY